jgi:DNA repair photolyase
LRALCEHGSPAGVLSKGTLIVRDEDILAQMSRGLGVTVLFSLNSLDEVTWRKLEPGTPPPRQRLRAMASLLEAGVRAGVFIAPGSMTI